MANSRPFLTIADYVHTEVLSESVEQEGREVEYMLPLKLSIPEDCIVLITVFHVALVLTQEEGRRGGQGELIYIYSPRHVLIAMFLESLWTLRNLEYRNAEFATLSM